MSRETAPQQATLHKPRVAIVTRYVKESLAYLIGWRHEVASQDSADLIQIASLICDEGQFQRGHAIYFRHMTVFGVVEALVNVYKPMAGLCTRLPFKVLQYSCSKLGLYEKKHLAYRATRISGCREKVSNLYSAIMKMGC